MLHAPLHHWLSACLLNHCWFPLSGSPVTRVVCGHFSWKREKGRESSRSCDQKVTQVKDVSQKKKTRRVEIEGGEVFTSFYDETLQLRNHQSLNSFANLSTLVFPPWTLGTTPLLLFLSPISLPLCPHPLRFRHAFYSLEEVAVKGGWCHGSMSLSQPSTQRMWITGMRPPSNLSSGLTLPLLIDPS